VKNYETNTCNLTASPLSSMQNCLQKYKPITVHINKMKQKILY